MKSFLLLLWAAAILMAQGQSPLLPENSVTRVSEHVYAIMGFPNVAIVVGNSATNFSAGSSSR